MDDGAATDEATGRAPQITSSAINNVT